MKDFNSPLLSPRMNSHLCFWKRYISDTLAIVKKNQSIMHFSSSPLKWNQVEEFFLLTCSLYRKTAALKQLFKAKIQRQAYISTGSHLNPTLRNEEY